MIIAVTGLPCTGKSTLAERLRQHLMWPAFSKDAIKETLFDTLGWSDRAWSRRLSDASYELLFNLLRQIVSSRNHAIAEGNFRTEHAARFGALRTLGNMRLVQIVCAAEGELLKRRFLERARSGTRHPGHVDEQTYRELEPQLALGTDVLRLDVADAVIEWNATQLDADIAPLLKRIERAML